MNDNSKIEGAKPLLMISANGEFSEVNPSDSPRLFEVIYKALSSIKASLTLGCILAAVESFRRLEPAKYQAYVDSIFKGIVEGMEEAERECNSKQRPYE